MDIDELREARRSLEREITGYVSACVESFRAHTGVSPSAIDIHMIDCTQAGDVEPRRAVSRTSVRLYI